MKPHHTLAAGCCALTLIGWWTDRALFYAAWLAVGWWAVGLVLGASANGFIHRLTGGTWGDAIQPALRAVATRSRWLPLVFVPVLVGAATLYPWLHGDAWTADIAEPGFIHAWLSPGFVVARVVGYVVGGWWLTRPVARQLSSGSAARALVAYAVFSSLAAVDVVMSLMPAWYSSVFGWLEAAGQLLGGTALSVMLAVRSGEVAKGPTKPPVSRDLGNLLLAYVMVHAYLAFMQFLIIWAENLPREIAWYLPRLQTGWAGVGIGLVVFQFALPMALLLSRKVKDDPRRLGGVAALIVAAQALDAAWTVVPSVQPHGAQGWWLLPLAFIGSGAALFGELERPHVA